MRNRSVRVARLADEAGLDVDETLIRLWDSGFDRIDSANSGISAAQASEARRALGLPSQREVSRFGYWQRALGVDREELHLILADAGIELPQNAMTLPKGGPAVLKAYARKSKLLETPPVTQDEVVHRAAPALIWQPVGRQPCEHFLDRTQVEQIHWTLARDFADAVDPIVPPGVRSDDLLESALIRQHTAMGEERKYPTVVMAASALFHSLVLNHAFHNGNKRTGLVSLLVLLDENGLMLTCDEDLLFQVVLRLANHELVPSHWDNLPDREVMWLSEWLATSSRPIEKGERPLEWRKLRPILLRMGCESAVVPGNRISIARTVETPSYFGRRRRRSLGCQIKYTDEGRQASRATIHEIRRKLELDEEHGTDSATFYGEAKTSVGDFIIRYRKTLSRLAKL